jgi:hypothetical protein
MACADRHSRTRSEAEVVAWTAPVATPAQTATVVHAAKRRWPHGRPCRHGLRKPPQSHMQRSGGGRMDGTCRHACADRHSRTRSEAEVAAWTALPSWPAQTASVAHAAKRRWPHGRHLRPWFGVARRGRLGVARSAGHQRLVRRHCFALCAKQAEPPSRHAATSLTVVRMLQSYCCDWRAHTTMTDRSILL